MVVLSDLKKQSRYSSVIGQSTAITAVCSGSVHAAEEMKPVAVTRLIHSPVTTRKIRYLKQINELSYFPNVFDSVILRQKCES